MRRRRAVVLVAALALGCHGAPAPAAPAAAGPAAEPAWPSTSDRSGERARALEAEFSASAYARVDEILEQQQQALHIPGLALVIAVHGQVVYREAFGLRDVEHQLPATVDTLFPIGSCTKAFTSMAIARAQDQGLLSLDDPPRKFLPWFKMADPDADAKVTLRDMLAHRTGLKAYADLAAEPGVLTREEYVRAATSARPVARLGERFQYSNAMFVAAGEILARVYGSTWEDAMAKQIFAPLGMTASQASLAGLTAQPDHATGYLTDAAGAWKAVPAPKSLDALAPAGAIASTARDMGRWLVMLTRSGEVLAHDFVSRAAFRELTTAKIAINDNLSYALGWVTYTWNGLAVVEHNGGSQGLSALVSFIPERQVGFVFLANTSPSGMTKIGDAAKLLYPVILCMQPPAPEAGPSTAPAAASAPAATESTTDLPTVDALLARMVKAAGGKKALARHTSFELHARKAYANQGVEAALTVLAKAPASRSEEEAWTAAGRDIGRLRVYFDGAHGAQETTFGQDAANDDAANAQARRDDTLHPLLELKRLYRTARVRSRETLDGKDLLVLELVPDAGDPVRLLVAADSALIVRRESGSETRSFDDYRLVDGERVPFRTTIEDVLGTTVIDVVDVRFGVELADSAFAPAPHSK